jgi:WD40 repeat protein
VKSERTRVSNNIIRSCLSLAFLPVVALLVPIGQDFYTHPAHAAIEINTNSLTVNTKSFVNPRLINTLQGHTSTVKSLVKSLNFSPNSKLLVSGGSEKEGMIRFWNPQTGKKLGTINW